MSSVPVLLTGLALGGAGAAIAFLYLSLDLSRYALSAFLILAAAGFVALVGLVFLSLHLRRKLGDSPKRIPALVDALHTLAQGTAPERTRALDVLKSIGVSVATSMMVTVATVRAFGFLFAAITVAVSAAILVATLMQVERLDHQNQLAEASRRAALINELTELLTEIDEEMDEHESPAPVGAKGPSVPGEGPTFVREGVPLTKRLVWRIVALSRSLKPYRFLEGGALSRLEYSPERAQLLISLVASGIELKDILRMGSFEHSHLRGAELSNIYLHDAKLSGSTFQGANLIQSRLSEVIARDVDFSDAMLFSVDMTQADLSRSNFSNARMPEPHQLAGADLTDANLDGARVSQASWLQDVLSQSNRVRGLDANAWQVDAEASEFRFAGGAAGIAHVLRRRPPAAMGTPSSPR